VIPSIVRLLRFASAVICVIVIVSFAVFAVDQTKGASTQQQQKIAGGVPTATLGASAPHGAAESAPARHGGVRKAIDDAASWLTTPFTGLVSASNGEWAIRVTKLLLALVVYGFGLGYLARAIGVRV
jgi:hypothetical protein